MVVSAGCVMSAIRGFVAVAALGSLLSGRLKDNDAEGVFPTIGESQGSGSRSDPVIAVVVDEDGTAEPEVEAPRARSFFSGWSHKGDQDDLVSVEFPWVVPASVEVVAACSVTSVFAASLVALVLRAGLPPRGFVLFLIRQVLSAWIAFAVVLPRSQSNWAQLVAAGMAGILCLAAVLGFKAQGGSSWTWVRWAATTTLLVSVPAAKYAGFEVVLPGACNDIANAVCTIAASTLAPSLHKGEVVPPSQARRVTAKAIRGQRSRPQPLIVSPNSNSAAPPSAVRKSSANSARSANAQRTPLLPQRQASCPEKPAQRPASPLVRQSSAGQMAGPCLVETGVATRSSQAIAASLPVQTAGNAPSRCGARPQTGRPPMTLHGNRRSMSPTVAVAHGCNVVTAPSRRSMSPSVAVAIGCNVVPAPSRRSPPPKRNNSRNGVAQNRDSKENILPLDTNSAKTAKRLSGGACDRSRVASTERNILPLDTSSTKTAKRLTGGACDRSRVASTERRADGASRRGFQAHQPFASTMNHCNAGGGLGGGRGKPASGFPIFVDDDFSNGKVRHQPTQPRQQSGRAQAQTENSSLNESTFNDSLVNPAEGEQASMQQERPSRGSLVRLASLQELRQQKHENSPKQPPRDLEATLDSIKNGCHTPEGKEDTSQNHRSGTLTLKQRLYLMRELKVAWGAGNVDGVLEILSSRPTLWPTASIEQLRQNLDQAPSTPSKDRLRSALFELSCAPTPSSIATSRDSLGSSIALNRTSLGTTMN